jgi:hypothetical protein
VPEHADRERVGEPRVRERKVRSIAIERRNICAACVIAVSL